MFTHYKHAIGDVCTVCTLCRPEKTRLQLDAERRRLIADLDSFVTAFGAEKRQLAAQETDIEHSLSRLEQAIAELRRQESAIDAQRTDLLRQRHEAAAVLERRLLDAVRRHLPAFDLSGELITGISTDVYGKPCTCSCACSCRNVVFCSCGPSRPCFCITHIVWFDMSLAGKPLARLQMALLGRTAPRTVENFYQRVVQGGYRATPVNWIKKNSWVAGGQLRSAEDGRPLPSIYGGDLEREPTRLRHYGAGWVHAWSNSGFRILLNREPTWDGQYVVFGRVTAGLSTVRRIASLEPLAGTPDLPVQIVDCGGSPVAGPLCLADLAGGMDREGLRDI